MSSLQNDRSFRPVHVSTDDITGGAAVAAHRLHRGLRRTGHDSRMLVSRRRSEDPNVERFVPPNDWSSRIRRRLRRRRIRRDHRRFEEGRPAWSEAFTDDRTPHAGDVLEAIDRCDVLHLHWFAGFLDYREIRGATERGVPVVWTLHDMNPFTGGCHYDAGCGRYTDACGACPQLGSDTEADLSREIWRRKRRVYRSMDRDLVCLVTPSRWLAEEVEESSLMGGGFRVETIPNGLDTGDFAPRDRDASRELVGIPPGARTILFVAHDPSFHRKGFALLAEALEELAGIPELHLLSLGKGRPEVEVAVPHRHLGFVSHDRMLSAVYSAADLFVIPSLQDNLPTTVLEAMSCGTPVVGFDAGGIPEMVQPGETGELAPVGDAGALGQRMAELLDDPDRLRRFGDRCRRRAVEEYSLERQVERYCRLYSSLLAPGSGGGGC